MERTLVILKPDAVQRGITGEIILRFEKAGLKIVGMKMLEPNEDDYFGHYETIGQVISRHGKHIYDANLKYMLQGPIVLVVLEGVEAVNNTRKMVGSTYPNEAQPGTIRGDLAHISKAHANVDPNDTKAVSNLIHASGDSEEAKKEIDHWFTKSELFNYKTLHEKYTYGH